MENSLLIKPSPKLNTIYVLIFAVVLVFGRFSTIDYAWTIYAWGILMVVGLLYFIYLHLKRVTFIYELDESNLTSHEGILSKKVVRVPLNRITNYEVKQSIPQRLVGLGDLLIDTAGGMGTELTMSEMEISDIEMLVRKLDQLLKAEKLVQTKPAESSTTTTSEA